MTSYSDVHVQVNVYLNLPIMLLMNVAMLLYSVNYSIIGQRSVLFKQRKKKRESNRAKLYRIPIRYESRIKYFIANRIAR